MTIRTRHEWVEARRVLDDAQPTPTLATFAFEDTAAVFDVEPRLRILAALAQRASLVAEDELWAGVEQLVSMLLGPTRSASQVTPVSAVSVAVTGTLSGEVVRRRFMVALRASVQEAA